MIYRLTLCLHLLRAKNFLLVTGHKNDDTSVMKTDLHLNGPQAMGIINFLTDKIAVTIQQDAAVNDVLKIISKK